jgi:Sulfatase-modifying factor enzyme 1
VQRTGARRRWGQFAPLALLLCGCQAEEPAGTRALRELERLCFVPPAECRLLPSTDLSLATPLVFDRFELTRADLGHYWPARRPRASQYAWQTEAARAAPERADWPAFLDFHEASELAALRSMRLPTPREWLHVAVGRLGFTSPWGGQGREFFANTLVRQAGADFSLGTPCAVGTYENGKSRPFGCYDLLGNVWEWVDGIVPGYEEIEEITVERDDAGGTRASVLGGAYDSLWRPTYEFDRQKQELRFHARRLDKRTLSPSIGARMCAEAGPYLWARAGAWGTDAQARARVVAVGRRWAEDALARSSLRTLLAELVARPGAAPGLGWLQEGVLAEP